MRLLPGFECWLLVSVDSHQFNPRLLYNTHPLSCNQAEPLQTLPDDLMRVITRLESAQRIGSNLRTSKYVPCHELWGDVKGGIQGWLRTRVGGVFSSRLAQFGLNRRRSKRKHFVVGCLAWGETYNGIL